MITPRAGWIVWLDSLGFARQLEKYGHVHYVSKRMHYAVLYVNEEEAVAVRTKLLRLPFVQKVEPSYRVQYAHMEIQHVKFKG